MGFDIERAIHVFLNRVCGSAFCGEIWSFCPAPDGSDLRTVASIVLTVELYSFGYRDAAVGRLFTLTATTFWRGGAGWVLRSFELSWLWSIVLVETLSKKTVFPSVPIRCGSTFKMIMFSWESTGVWRQAETEKMPFLRPTKLWVKAEVHLSDVSSSVAYRCFALKWDILCLISRGLRSCVLKHST